MTKFFAPLLAAVAILGLCQTASAQAGRWVRETYGHYFSAQDAHSVAMDLHRGGDPTIRNITYDNFPHPVTGTYGVYFDRFHADPAPPAALGVGGTLSRHDPLDRFRAGCHAKVFTTHLAPGRSYTIDLMSGNGRNGPGFFDTWLRIEDSAGNVLANNDDGGDGYNSRIVFTPSRPDTYRLVVTSYRAGATGSFQLSIR